MGSRRKTNWRLAQRALSATFLPRAGVLLTPLIPNQSAQHCERLWMAAANWKRCFIRLRCTLKRWMALRIPSLRTRQTFRTLQAHGANRSLLARAASTWRIRQRSASQRNNSKTRLEFTRTWFSSYSRGHVEDEPAHRHCRLRKDGTLRRTSRARARLRSSPHFPLRGKWQRRRYHRGIAGRG